MDDCNFKTILNNINMPSMLMPYRVHYIKMVTKDLKNILKEAKVKDDSFIIYDLIDISMQNTIIKNFANNPEFCFVYCYKTSSGLSVFDGITDFKIKKRITDFCNEIEESAEKFMTKVNLKSDNNDITEKIVDDVIQSYGFDENKLPQIVLDQIYDDNKVACNKLLFNNFFANLFEPIIGINILI